jgi:hypothetical protein
MKSSIANTIKSIVPIKAILNNILKKPKIIFLIDSVGALLTTFFLFVILRNYSEYFGMPKTILTYLSAIAASFCIYSTTCYLVLKEKWTEFITIISVANILYCALTLGFLILHHSQLTTLGLVYFLLEIIIICILVFIELTVVTKIKK